MGVRPGICQQAIARLHQVQSARHLDAMGPAAERSAGATSFPDGRGGCVPPEAEARAGPGA